MFNKKVVATFLGAALMAGAQSASAGTEPSAIINYDIELIDNCSLNASGAFFGSYPISSGDLLGLPAGGIEVVCPPNLSYRIMVDGGMWGGNGLPRFMVDPTFGEALEYHILDVKTGWEVGDANPIDGTYQPVNNRYDWADGIDGTGTGALNYHGLVADILINTTAVPGVYHDEVGITITF